MNYKELKKEVGHLITLGALIEKLMMCGNCKHFYLSYTHEESIGMCFNPNHYSPEKVNITELCGNWNLNERK